jgi:RHS repeat-associated protein
MAYDYRYYFDGVGNRTKFIRTDLWTSDRTVVYEYSARNELTRYSDPEGSGKYWVCEYDLRGNRTKWRHTFWTDSWYSYGWDAQDRLTKVYSNSNAKTTEYKYDHAGRRAAKRVNSGAGFGAWTWYLYDGLKVVAEGTSSTSKMYYTTAPGDPGGIICRDASAGTNPLYYHYDRLGNVMAVSDSNGAPYAPYTMDAYGNVLQVGTSTGYSASQSDPQPYHLTTKEWDPDTALFYFNARWYDRGTGRFVSLDPYRVLNRYQFASSNPISSLDTDGKQDCPITLSDLIDEMTCPGNCWCRDTSFPYLHRGISYRNFSDGRQCIYGKDGWLRAESPDIVSPAAGVNSDYTCRYAKWNVIGHMVFDGATLLTPWDWYVPPVGLHD